VVSKDAKDVQRRPHPSSMPSTTTAAAGSLRPLSSVWQVWAHRRDDNTWSAASYMHLADISTVEEFWFVWGLHECDVKGVSESVRQTQLFVMRKGVAPMWEDPSNKNGGAWTLKLTGDAVLTTMQDALVRMMVGDPPLVTGLSCVPKPENNCQMLKCWMTGCDSTVPGGMDVLFRGARFIKHRPKETTSQKA
jgi:Eukaryotic initiation factor 4E